MKKILISALCLVLAVSVYAESAKSQSTAGTMASDVDNISTMGIFNIDQGFFTLGTNGTSFPIFYSNYINGAFAMPLNDDMTIATNVNTYVNISDSDSKYVGNRTITNNDYSDITLNTVFALNNLSFAYNVNKTGTTTKKTISNTDISTGIVKDEESTTTNGSTWIHGLDFAMDLGSMKFNTPVTVTVAGKGAKKSKEIDSSKGEYLTTTTETNTNNGQYVNVKIAPTAMLALDNEGPLTYVTGGVSFDMNVFNPGATETKTVTNEGTAVTNEGTDKKEETVTDISKKLDLGTAIKVGANAEWKKEMLTFVAQPSLNVAYTRTDGGTSTATVVTTTDYLDNITKDEYYPTITKNNVTDTITTTFGTGLGIEVTPAEWFSLRLGANANLTWENKFTTYFLKAYNNAPETDRTSRLTSSFKANIGCGFVIAKDFELDLKYNGINFIPHGEWVSNNWTTDGNKYGYSLNVFTITATYKF